jgi:predicted adenine nucleotide alpha hydrolase (AANH) superfamily ATPase
MTPRGNGKYDVEFSTIHPMYEYIEARAKKEKRTFDDVFIGILEAHYLPDSRLVERIRAVEHAADLEPGSLYEAFLEMVEGDTMQWMIESGWDLENQEASLAAVSRLQRKWNHLSAKAALAAS